MDSRLQQSATRDMASEIKSSVDSLVCSPMSADKRSGISMVL